ncbi:glycosyltransferase family 2 protein, partial [Methylocella sp.]|uniref:glycosyltransferase family 2 protein n=1 Tax=Methylocella sp. TaxID=1978226 RepID=UPI003C1CDC21
MNFEPSSFLNTNEESLSARKEDGLGDSMRAIRPLVSVIVTNYNYAAFLEQAVSSVMSQTYPNIECVIVDDRSTDESPSVIARLKTRYPNLRTFVNEANGGQSVSCLEGFERTLGAYVIFLDADDYLLPDCVETHIRAHLSLRIPVGFTSVDMIQLVNERITTTTFEGFSNFVRSGAGLGHNIVREWEPQQVAGQPKLKKSLHYVPARDAGQWPWAPTSANCFRRDALNLVMNNRRLRELRINTDTYLLRGVTALCGSVLVDAPLAVYRIHPSNNFTLHADLHHLRAFKTSLWKQNSQIAMSSIIDHIVDSLPELSLQMEYRYIVEALIGLSDAFPKVEASRFGLNYLTEVLLKRRRWFFDTIGKDRFYDILSYGSKPKKRFLTLLANGVLPVVSWAIDRGYIFPAAASGPGAPETKVLESTAISSE